MRLSTKHRYLFGTIAVAMLVLAVCVWRSDFFRTRPSSPISPSAGTETTRMTGPAAEPGSVTRSESNAIRVVEPGPAVGEHITIVGRIVDAARAPIRDARVLLRTPGEPWSRAADAPEAMVTQGRLNAWESITDHDGVFRYQVPPPESEFFELSSTSSIHLARLFTQFTRKFVAGTNDLGEFVLDARGAIGGVVRTQSGEPVEHAMVTSPGADVSVYTDARGHYLLGGVHEGIVTVSVSPLLYLHDSVYPGPLTSSSFSLLQQDAVRSGIQVQNGATSVLDITLDPATVLSGRIVDTSGRPVAGADIKATPADGEGRWSPGVSRQDGSFAMRLSRSVPHHLEVTAAGFARQRLERTFEQTTDDILVVLTPAEQFTFRVVDHRSGQPVERFGIGVVYPADSLTGAFGYVGPDAPHVGGEVELSALPLEQVVRVSAHGFAPVELPVASDLGISSVQTVRMHAGAIVEGRVVDRGTPVTGVLVSIQRTYVGDDGSGKPAGSAPMDLSLWLGGGRRSARSDTNGAFRIEHLPAGTWALSIRGESVEPRTVAVLTIAEDASIDAGTIETTPGASIVGRLIVPAGRSPARIFVQLDGNPAGRMSDDSGSFRFDGVAPGKHTISCQRNSLAATGDHSVEVELAAGEMKEITIDLTETLAAYVLVRVVRALVPVKEAQLAMDANGSTVQWHAGTTGADGMSEVECPPNRSVDLWVVGAAQTNLGATGTMTLAPEQHVERQITIVDGTFEIELPDTLAVPEDGWVEIGLRTNEGRQFAFIARTRTSSGARDAEWTSRRIVVGSVPPAEYAVSARVHAQVSKPVGEKTEALVCTSVVRSGETTFAKPK